MQDLVVTTRASPYFASRWTQASSTCRRRRHPARRLPSHSELYPAGMPARHGVADSEPPSDRERGALVLGGFDVFVWQRPRQVQQKDTRALTCIVAHLFLQRNPQMISRSLAPHRDRMHLVLSRSHGTFLRPSMRANEPLCVMDTRIHGHPYFVDIMVSNPDRVLTDPRLRSALNCVCRVPPGASAYDSLITKTTGYTAGPVSATIREFIEHDPQPPLEEDHARALTTYHPLVRKAQIIRSVHIDDLPKMARLLKIKESVTRACWSPSSSGGLIVRAPPKGVNWITFLYGIADSGTKICIATRVK